MERGTQRPRGFGFVTLATRKAAEEAISKMDQAQLNGRMIRVNESKPRGEGPADRDRGIGPGGAGGFDAVGNKEVKLYVENLSFDTTEDKSALFSSSMGQSLTAFSPQIAILERCLASRL
jgi:RNA recognition motif-containing protein